METVIHGIGFLATGLLLGAMVFFSAVMAPLIFTKLAGDVAGRFIRQVFPWYYLTIIGLGGLAALALLRFHLAEAIGLAGVAITGILTRQVLMPRINRARDASVAGDAAAGTRFWRLHRLSVWINALQIIATGTILARLVPPPA